MATPVIYRTYPTGEVVALFPALPADLHGRVTSYMHLGQHGAADWDHVLAKTRPATPTEYDDLHRELVELVGYDDLVVYARQTPEHRQQFDCALSKWRGELGEYA